MKTHLVSDNIYNMQTCKPPNFQKIQGMKNNGKLTFSGGDSTLGFTISIEPRLLKLVTLKTIFSVVGEQPPWKLTLGIDILP
jgi:hypothetical protein